MAKTLWVVAGSRFEVIERYPGRDPREVVFAGDPWMLRGLGGKVNRVEVLASARKRVDWDDFDHVLKGLLISGVQVDEIVNQG